MKKSLIITAIALVAATGMTLNATAQGPNFDPANCPVAGCPGGGMMGGPGHHHGAAPMMKGLNLTDAQQTQVQSIMTQEREDTHAKIRAILTPEQQTTFDARKQQRDAWFEQRQKSPGGGRMMNDLNLTDTQKAQISDLMAQHREDTHAKIRAVLTPEQQATFDAHKQQRDARFEQRQKRFQ
jgi:Spy/CpxP family protein refolding chaperone